MNHYRQNYIPPHDAAKKREMRTGRALALAYVAALVVVALDLFVWRA